MLLLEDVGRLYEAELLRPPWDRLGARISSREALALFCSKYAYERAGASPDYPLAAAQAISTAGPARGREPDPAEVWTVFGDLVDRPLNPRANPLWHRGRRCNCLLCIFGAMRDSRAIVTWARHAIADDEVDKAHAELMRVRGVGPKIASFFLRDVSLNYGLAPEGDRCLLQPVDMWVKRFVRMLEPGLVRSRDRDIATWVVANFEEPELANAGLWYFGARIAPRRLDYEQAFLNPTDAETRVERYVAGMRAAVDAWTSCRRA